uniref:DUF6429 domain-containing protein n=1 Tax=Candidatus Kentrum sp. LFY TaxID=2126342 RepID=A0A450V1Y2_9GAMM|nr:MAG: hypothetical protein BECKLFY1418A_GA0070994_101813 [Candidatus Kentron sp. LFY]VFJ98793.1 MAG: hypothetical protein BECKLFY1418B_GA0070995_112810 [Candidatus Kentron sp. LFY]VFK18915.1 MAG: hypothetical protein BECKLFY1418C_GA0070996_105019 [Candidatus Kentron sp. LFY]
MDYNENKVDDYTLALMYLVMFRDGFDIKAWKEFDWDTLGRLYEKGFITNPKGKARSVTMTEAGEEKADALFHEFFVES